MKNYNNESLTLYFDSKFEDNNFMIFYLYDIYLVYF